MSAEVLAQTPTAFDHDAKTYSLAVADYDLELYFQARHEAWARNRIEATAAMVSAQSYRTDCEVFAGQRAGNLFAFSSALSMSWLLSEEGMIEYLILLSQKGRKEQGGAAFDKSGLRQMARFDKAEWDRLVKLVLGRDFPNLLAAPTTPGPATPAPTTNGSSNCSPAPPTSSPAEKSSASPAPTSLA